MALRLFHLRTINLLVTESSEPLHTGLGSAVRPSRYMIEGVLGTSVEPEQSRHGRSCSAPVVETYEDLKV